MKPLTNKQRAFVAEYMKDCNAGAAAARAGYSARSAKTLGQRLLTDPRIAAAVAEMREEADSRAVASMEECCQRLTQVIRANVFDFLGPGGDLIMDGGGNPAALQEAIREEFPDGRVRVRVKLRDPVQAMARLAAFLGMDKPRQLEVDMAAEIVIPNTLKGLD
jgi:phage terminase small subunit